MSQPGSSPYKQPRMDGMQNSSRTIPLTDFWLYDRFCPSCGIRILDGWTKRTPKCPRCIAPVPGGQENGIWNPCFVCGSFNECTFKYCYMCGAMNDHYDPSKPHRLDAAIKKKARFEVMKELEDKKREEEARAVAEAAEDEICSQALMDHINSQNEKENEDAKDENSAELSQDMNESNNQ